MMLPNSVVIHDGDSYVLARTRTGTVPGAHGWPVDTLVHELAPIAGGPWLELVTVLHYGHGVTADTHPRPKLELAPGCERCGLPRGRARCHLGDHDGPVPPAGSTKLEGARYAAPCTCRSWWCRECTDAANVPTGRRWTA